MKILVVGGKGTIGRHVVARFAAAHEVLVAGRSAGDVTVDLTDAASIEAMFEQTGKLDAVVCIAGDAKWAPFNELSEEDYYIGFRSKLMGQVNLVRIGQAHVNPGGSFTPVHWYPGRQPCCHDCKRCDGQWCHPQLCKGRFP